VFGVHSVVGKYDGRLGDAADQVSSPWRSQQLEHTWLGSAMTKH
jgi:hypothetical protein